MCSFISQVLSPGDDVSGPLLQLLEGFGITARKGNQNESCITLATPFHDWLIILNDLFLTIISWLAMNLSPAVVIDNGSGFTKVGFSGAAEPQCVFQSAIGRRLKRNKDSPLSDLEFATGGDNALQSFGSNYESIFPIKHGIVEDWNAMEHLWTNCFYEKLRVNTEDHPILLTETPLNTPENREQAAELLFETFNVPALNISVQAVLSLASSWANEKVVARELTGTVIDSGYGSTQIVPVVDGHVMSSCIEQYPIGGRDVTSYIQQLMRDRKEPVPTDMGVETARAIKERFTYTCPSIEKECQRFDSNPGMYIKQYENVHKKTGKAWACNVEYERFLAPEVVMDPKVSMFEGPIDNSSLSSFPICGISLLH